MTIFRTDRHTATPERGIPDATVARLPLYLRALTHLTNQGLATCSSDQLAEAAGVNSNIVRKDLSFLGSYGTRGVGYDVTQLHDEIARSIGLNTVCDVVIVGAGHLGTALARYQGFGPRSIRIAAIVDSSEDQLGRKVGDVTVKHLRELPELVAELQIALGVIATPAGSAQSVVQALVDAGVTSILNFAPATLQVPDGVDLRQVDVAAELQILAYHEQRKQHGQSADPGISSVAGVAL